MRPAAIQGVTILCDLLRPDPHGAPGAVDRLATWLFNALKRQVQLACGRPVRLYTPTTDPELAGWITAQRRFDEADGYWAAAYDAPASRDLEDRLVTALHDQFCIGYELPPYLSNLLAANGIPHVDIRVHPIRFLDDLLFAVRASHLPTQHAILAEAVAEAEIVITAGLREAMCQFISTATVPPGTLLVLGQRRFDATQIVGGRFFDAMDHIDAVAAICAGYPAVILKPHPLDTEHSLLNVAASVGANVIGVVNDNIYRLLALPEIAAVMSVSSSVAHEAKYFAKTIHTLAPPPIDFAWRDEPFKAGAHVAVSDAMLSIDFWRMVLAAHGAVSAVDGVRLPPKPNRLRLAMDSFWTFNAIDTDRLPRPS